MRNQFVHKSDFSDEKKDVNIYHLFTSFYGSTRTLKKRVCEIVGMIICPKMGENAHAVYFFPHLWKEMKKYISFRVVCCSTFFSSGSFVKLLEWNWFWRFFDRNTFWAVRGGISWNFSIVQLWLECRFIKLERLSCFQSLTWREHWWTLIRVVRESSWRRCVRVITLNSKVRVCGLFLGEFY